MERPAFDPLKLAMKTIAVSIRRSYAAFAVQSVGARMATMLPSIALHQKINQDDCNYSLGKASRLLSVSTVVDFVPPEPPGTHGTPVFPNVDLTGTTPLTAQTRNNDANAVFVVTGASRGLGREFVHQLLDRTKGTVIACCRKPEDCADLAQNSRVHVVQLDLEDQTTIEAAGNRIREKHSRVDLLLNVAGILGDAKTTPGPERSIAALSRSWLERTMAINLIGPVMLTKELFPLLKQRRNKDEQRPKSVVVNLSARVGSISDNYLGGWYSYRMSKSALNQATRTMALELKRHDALAIALHPGTTKTDLSKPFQVNVKEGSLFPVEFTVQQLLNVIEAVTEDHSGGLYDWAGKSISF